MPSHASFYLMKMICFSWNSCYLWNHYCQVTLNGSNFITHFIENWESLLVWMIKRRSLCGSIEGIKRYYRWS